MKVTIISNTVYQIIMAYCIIMEFPDDTDCTLIISDHTSQAHKVYEKINELIDSNDQRIIFKHTAYVTTKKYQDKTPETKDEINKADGYIQDFYEKYVKGVDHYFFGNLDYFNWRLIKKFCKNNTPELDAYEDGVGAYVLDHHFEKKDLVHNVWHRFNNDPGFITRNYYYLQPSKVALNLPGKLHKINFDRNNQRLKTALNLAFSYSDCVDSYDEPIIFFEDGAIDFGTHPEVDIVDRIGQEIGKEKIFVKSHPRNTDNTYAKLGFKTNVDTFVPWEIIAMNTNLKGKVLLTYYSQAVVTPLILFGQNDYTAINLSQLKEREKRDRDDVVEMWGYWYKYYYSQYPKQLYVPKDLDEAIEIIKGKMVN